MGSPPTRWISHPPADWRVGTGPGPASILEEVLACQQIWAWLTRTQRAVILAADDRHVAGHPVTVRNLRARGLVDADGGLTDAGALVRKWNTPTEPKGPTK